MSGGSYNYLGYKGAEEIIDSRQDLDRMSERLAKLGYAEDAAKETEEVILIIRQFLVRIDARMSRLNGVWHAIEWWDSADWGEEEVKQALAKYRGEGKPNV